MIFPSCQTQSSCSRFSSQHRCPAPVEFNLFRPVQPRRFRVASALRRSSHTPCNTRHGTAYNAANSRPENEAARISHTKHKPYADDRKTRSNLYQGKQRREAKIINNGRASKHTEMALEIHEPGAFLLGHRIESRLFAGHPVSTSPAPVYCRFSTARTVAYVASLPQPECPMKTVGFPSQIIVCRRPISSTCASVAARCPRMRGNSPNNGA